MPGPPAVERPGMFVFTIEVEIETGRVQVHGPIAQKVLALGVLEIAKEIVLKFDPTKATGLVRPGPQWVG